MREQKELYALLRHLKNCPNDFLEPGQQAGAKPVTEALVYDLFRNVMGNLTASKDTLPDIISSLWAKDENVYKSINIGVWFLTQPLFTQPSRVDGIRIFLFDRLPQLCQYVKYQQWIDDEDRAEEFVREALQCCNLFVDGETLAEAQDKLEGLSTIKRQRVLEETNESTERMRAIRQAMAEKKAREAANVYGRE